MLLKWSYFKYIRECLSPIIKKNYVGAVMVHSSKLILQRNIINISKWPLKWPLLKYGGTLSGFTALTTIFYSSSIGDDDDVETNLAHLMQLAKIALEGGDIDRAEQILHISLRISEEHKLYSSIPFIYDILASLAVAEGKTEKAELLLVEVIEKLTKLGFPDDNHNIIDFRLRLARMYSTSGYITLANVGFQNCLEQQKAKILDGDLSEKTGLLYVHILFWFGVHKIKMEKYTEAKQLIKNAYDYSTKIKGLSPKQEMIILYTLADVNAELGDYEIALSSMLDAVILGKGIGSVDLPLVYLKLGSIYEKLEQMEKARISYEEAKTQGQVFGYADVVNEAVAALSNLNNYSESRRVS